MAHRYKVIQGGPYPHLITCTIVRWLPVFISGAYFKLITDSLRHVHENRGLALHAYVIMPTHLHAIVSAQEDNLSDIIRDFKKYTARTIYEFAKNENNILLTWMFERAAKNEQRSRFKVWQDEFHPKMIPSQDIFLQKAQYVHLNPVRKGLVRNAENWYYSSAADYAALGVGPLEIDYPEW